MTVNQLASLCLVLSSGKGGDSHRGSSRGYKINWVIHVRAWVGARCRLTLLFGPPRLLWLLLLLLFSLRGDQRYGGVRRYDYRVGMREQRRGRNDGGRPVTPDAPSATPVLVLLAGWDLILPFRSENTWGLPVSREDKRGSWRCMWGVLCTSPLREVSFHRNALRSHVLNGGASSQDEGGTGRMGRGLC